MPYPNPFAPVPPVQVPCIDSVDEVILNPDSFLHMTGRVITSFVNGVSSGYGRWTLSKSEYDLLTPGQRDGLIADLDLDTIADLIDLDEDDSDDRYDFQEYEDIICKIVRCFEVLMKTLIEKTLFDEIYKRLIINDRDCSPLFSNIATYRITPNGNAYTLTIRIERDSFDSVFDKLINKYID